MTAEMVSTLFAGFQNRKEKRVAFVLGNGAYQKVGKLDNPRNDADAVENALEELGFLVTLGVDLSHDETEKSFAEFVKSLDDVDVALLYYSGHGVQIDGENYLVPIGTEIARADPLVSLIGIQDLINRISEKVDTRVVILDACRNNPFAANLTDGVHHTKGLPKLKKVQRAKAVDGGLAEFDAGPGSFLAFAAAPGQIAYEGTGEVSFFTEALLRHIRTYGLEINPLMNRVRASVLEQTNYRQTPWSNSSLPISFWFRPKNAIPILALAGFGILSALICNLWDPHTALDPGAWVILRLFIDDLNGFLSHVHGTDRVIAPIYYMFLNVNPAQGIVFGSVIGAAVWIWGRRTWWSAPTAFTGTLLAWFVAMIFIIEYTRPLVQTNIENDVQLWADILALQETMSVLFLSIAGAIGAVGVYISCAITTRAPRNITIIALTVGAGILAVWPYYLIDKGNLLILYLFWQPAIAACIGYAFASYLPDMDEFSVG